MPGTIMIPTTPLYTPKRFPSRNPLLRWSIGINWALHDINKPTSSVYMPSSLLSEFKLSSAAPVVRHCVGLEGCRKAFNATNAVRTSLYFGTVVPPVFIGAISTDDIQSLVRPDHGENGVLEEKDNVNAQEDNKVIKDQQSPAYFPEQTAMLFGSELPPPEALLCCSSNNSITNCHSGKIGAPPSREVTRWKTVALENYTARSVSVHQERFTHMVGDMGITGVSDNVICGVAIVAGDENKGVSQDAIRRADSVLFVPQYGTISSLNVVTSIGIGLFYSWIDSVCPTHRVIVNGEYDHLMSNNLRVYFNAFRCPLPLQPSYSSDPVQEKSIVNTSNASCALSEIPSQERVDKRPIHPSLYSLDPSDIRLRHKDFIKELAGFVDQQHKVGAPISGNNNNKIDGMNETVHMYKERNKTTSTITSSLLGHQVHSTSHRSLDQRLLSVMYENEFDQRNFGGLIRNANAFLCKDIFYSGRRRFNIKGAVGCHHYTTPIHVSSSAGRRRGSLYGIADGEDSPTEINNNDDEKSIGQLMKTILDESDREMWFLSCGQEALYMNGAVMEEDLNRVMKVQEGVISQRKNSKNKMNSNNRNSNCHKNNSNNKSNSNIDYPNDSTFLWDDYLNCLSTPASMEAMQDLQDGTLGRRSFALTDPEEFIREELLCKSRRNGVILLIPQDGKLPNAELLSLCSVIVNVLPRVTGEYKPCSGQNHTNVELEVPSSLFLHHRGLPSQVASAIALQRLLTCAVPTLKI